jgi:hypothetical protein
VLVEQGQTFTIVVSRHPAELPESAWDDPAEAFVSARRVWLPAAPGTDWLHEGAAQQLGPTGIGYTIDSRRRSTQIGAGGEFLEVALLLYVLAENTEIGRRLQADLYEWVKRRAAERRKETGFDHVDPAPDFSDYPRERLTEGLKDELADVAKVPKARLELVSADRRDPSELYAIYRDTKTGVEYAVEVGQDDVTYLRLDR